MKKSLIIVAVLLFVLSSCRDKDPKIKKIYELSPEMKAYFVDYAVGTKWIYQDTLDKNNFDTIELVSKVPMDVNSGSGTLSKGYDLNYKPKKSKDFRVRVTPGVNNTYYVKIDPMEAGVSALSFENKNNSWLPATYFDSIEITGSIYYKVIVSSSSNLYYSRLSVSKNKGIVFFHRKQGGAIWGAYKLIKMLQP